MHRIHRWYSWNNTSTKNNWDKYLERIAPTFATAHFRHCISWTDVWTPRKLWWLWQASMSIWPAFQAWRWSRCAYNLSSLEILQWYEDVQRQDNPRLMFWVALPLIIALKLYASVKFFSVSSIIFIYYCVFNYNKSTYERIQRLLSLLPFRKFRIYNKMTLE